MTCAAKRAVDQSSEADRRCLELAELTRSAQEQAASVRDLATSLTQSAASVARVALDVCRYHSYVEGYEATLAATGQRALPIDLDTFLSLVESPQLQTAVTAGSTIGGERGATTTGSFLLGTCNELDEMMLNSYDSYDRQRVEDVMPARHDDITDQGTDDVMAQLTATARESHRPAVACCSECQASSFFHSVSVPAMYVQPVSVLYSYTLKLRSAVNCILRLKSQTTVVLLIFIHCNDRETKQKSN